VVNIDVSMDYKVRPIWNVLASIPGDSEETIMLGNHRYCAQIIFS
jgi:hypothetical protein